MGRRPRPFQLLFLVTSAPSSTSVTSTPGAATEMPLQVSYLHIGGLNFFDGELRRPYIVGGLGATFLSPTLSGTASRARGPR